MHRSIRMVGIGFVLAGLLTGVLATSAAAKPPPVTKMKFHLDDHQVAAGELVPGSLCVYTRQNHEWVPFAGASVDLSVDFVYVTTLVTDALGCAVVSYDTTGLLDGDHVMKVFYAGDEFHKRAKRAQGFEVGVFPDEDTEVEPPETIG